MKRNKNIIFDPASTKKLTYVTTSFLDRFDVSFYWINTRSFCYGKTEGTT